jgi:threonine synthase
VAAEAIYGKDASPSVVVLGTAHPAKFPDAVKAASGAFPDTPPALVAVMTAETRSQDSAVDPAAIAALITATLGAR